MKNIVEAVYVAPGNGGTAQVGSKVCNINAKPSDFEQLIAEVRRHEINLVVPGPEQPLVDGIVDYFRARLPATVRLFGPSKRAATLEGSKTFSKDFMRRHNIPTARYQNFSHYEKAKQYLDTVDYNIVIKATGLAGGKGVVLPETKEEAYMELKEMMLEKKFKAAGDEVVIEERLEGEEISILSFCDGHTIKSLPPAQDHKRINFGDEGLNTGGMGCYAPTDVATPEVLEQIHRTVLQPTIDGMRKEECLFVGLLFTGYMLTKDGPKVLEYNVRFGDPETQTLLPLMDADVADLMLACTDGCLDALQDSKQVPVKAGSSCTVVAAAGGYPEKYDSGDVIIVEPGAANGHNQHIFHAGTLQDKSENLITSGGRVIAAAAIAPSLDKAVASAYEIMRAIHFPKMHYRKDIAHRALKHAAKVSATQNLNGTEAMTYASTGVSIDNGEKLVQKINPMVASTRRPGAQAELGGFGGVFDLTEAGYLDARTVTGTDGVGTKLLIALAMNKHDTVGIDLVAMNANDIVVSGAEPLYLTDVYSCHRLDIDVAVEVVKGICEGCRQANCALVGGETAEMGDMFKEGEYDVTATVTGAISVKDIILPNKEAMKAGDVLLGLASSGCHSNGFSLIRKIIERSGLKYSDPPPWRDVEGHPEAAGTVGESLLTPTRIYVKSLMQAVRKNLVKGMAHITGGGLIENVPRMLPKHLEAELDASRWHVPTVQTWLKKAGNVENHEFARVFNTGLGIVMVVASDSVLQTQSVLEQAGESVYVIGHLRERQQEGCIVSNMECWRS